MVLFFMITDMISKINEYFRKFCKQNNKMTIKNFFFKFNIKTPFNKHKNNYGLCKK